MRAWLTYITLIFAALILIGDLVAVVYNFLSGELGVRFLAKAGIVGVISAAILINFTRDAERETGGVDWVGRALAIVASLVTLALVLWAFFLVDTPAAARAQSFDVERMNDMQMLARRVDCHRTYFGETPESLSALQASLESRTEQFPVAPGCDGDALTDPETDAPYRYERLGGDGFRICATFARGWPDSDDAENRYSVRTVAGKRRNLKKPTEAGEACFDLEAVDLEAD